MARRGISVVQLRHLRAELRGLRKSSGYTQKQVATGLDWSLSKVIRIETGASTISMSDLRALLHFYHVVDAERSEELLSIARSKRGTWWWDGYRDFLGPQFLGFLEYEYSATRIREIQSLVIPGLLQTESYARALFQVHHDSDTAERGVRVRLRRQEILNRADVAELCFVLDESVLHWRVGGREVMAEQLRHLEELNGGSHVKIRVVPFSAGVHTGMGRSFTVLDLAGQDDHDIDRIVVVEEPQGDTLVTDDLDSATGYAKSFDEIYESALGRVETNDLLNMLKALL